MELIQKRKILLWQKQCQGIIMSGRVAKQRRGDVDCVSSKSNTIVCSSKHSNQADLSSVFKSPHVHPSRRRSPRLKGIKAVYKVDDARYSNLQQQCSEDNSQCSDNQNFGNPTLEQDHKSGNKHTKSCGDEEGITDPDGLIVIDMTLKDIQTRCKGRKRKTLKTAASSASDLQSDHTFFKPEDEEPDLDKPLISLKSKLSNISFTEKTQKKCSHPSESFFPVEKTTAQPSLVLMAHCASPIETDKVPIKKDLTANISVSTDKNTGMISLNDPLLADRSHLISEAKSEIIDNYLGDMQRMDDGAVSSSLVYDDSCNVPDNSSAELLQNVSEGKSGNGKSCCFIQDVHNIGVINHIDAAIHNSSHSLSVMGANNQVDRPEPAYFVQSETSEAETQVFENTIYVSDSPTTDFIAKVSYSGSSSNQLVEKVGGNSMFGGSTYLTTTSEPLPYLVYEVSSRLKDDNYTNLSEEHFGEILEESSQQSFLKLSPSLSGPKIPFSLADGCGLVLATMDLSSAAFDAIENQTTPQEETKDKNATNGENCSAGTDSQQSMSPNDVGESNMNVELSNQVDEATKKTQTCSLQDCVTFENNLLCGERNDLKMVSYSRSERGCLDNLLLEAFAGDPLSKGNKNDNVFQAEDCSSGVTYNVRPPPQSNTNFSALYDLHSINESSSKSEVYSSTLEQMVHGYGERATSPEVNNHSSNPEEPTETLGHSPPISPTCRSAINDSHNVEDSLCKAAEHILPYASEEKPQQDTEVPNFPSTETSCSIYDVESMEKETECDQDVKVEYHPKKLLSNRKDLSPTSKELLLRALNGNDLYDTKQNFGCGETEAMICSRRMMKRKKTHPLDYEEADVLMRSNRMMKRTRSSNDGSLPPVTREILRSPDKSGLTCSCMESTLIHTQAQKAITFSQRQMQDVENIATKLLRELKSMKNIVEYTLADECPLAPPKYTPEEIQTATQSVSALEATTRKWLSMMTKDCNRFCKIMTSTENKVGTSANGLKKQRKKITFADEAGGLLCHVKIFEQQSDFFEGPRSEG